MSKAKFYTMFGILNVLLIVFLSSCFYLFLLVVFDIQGSGGVDIRVYLGFAFYFVYMIIKLLLPKIFIIWSEKHKNSLINEIVEFIRDNPQQKKFILSLAFCFDLILLIFGVMDGRNLQENLLEMIIRYFIFYAGGVFFFYFILYRELGIKAGKIRPFF